MRDEVPPILVTTGLSAISEVTEESVDSLLSGVAASRTEFEIAKICLEEGIEAGLTGVTIESHSYEMPEALKINFLNSLIKTKKHVQKKRPIPSDFSKAPPSEKTIAVEEHDPSTIFLLFSVPSLATPTEVIPLSDSNRKTERYLERGLLGAVAKGPFVQISPDVEGIERSLELGHGGTMETEVATTKDASTSAVEKGGT